MKRIATIIILIIMLCLIASALSESNDDRQNELSQIAVKMETWNQELEKIIKENQNEDASIVLNYASRIIRITQECILKDVQNPANELQIENLKVEPELGHVDNYTYYTAALHLLEGTGAYAAGDVMSREGFLLARYSLYDVDGDYLGTVRAETAKRDDERIILVVDYDNLENTTGRFAVLIRDEKPEVIFTKTLGMNLYTVLDVSAWQMGVDYGKWNKQLLLPVHY